MSRKDRKITQFDAVANDINSNNDSHNDSNSNINNILDKHREKRETHIFRGYYLEREVANAIDSIAAGKPKGVKSELVNEIIKKYLKEEGYM